MNKKLLYYTLVFSLFFLSTIAQQEQCKMNSFLASEVLRTRASNIDVLVKGDLDKIQQYIQAKGGTIKYTEGDIVAITIPLKEVQNFSQCNFVERVECTKNNLVPLDDSSLRKNNILPIHSITAPLTQAYTGKGIIIGIIDTGTDFTHPDFKDSLGKTRLLWLWDQRSTTASATTPKPFNYGREWSKQKIDSGFCTHIDDNSMGHGTKVAGVAAGNGKTAKAYKGIAPDADIITVAIDFNNHGSTISDAVKYIVTKATALGKPFVINISLGDYYGTHDGKDLQTQTIESLMGNTPGRALVCAAGNRGNLKTHLAYTVKSDTSFTWLSNATKKINFQICADTANFNKVYYTFGLHGPDYSYKGNVGFRKVNTCIGKILTDTLKYNGNRYGILESYCDYYKGNYFLDMLFTPDSLNYFWTFETTGSGKLDGWGTDFVYANLPSSSKLPRMAYYKKPDSLQSICATYQCSDKFITVANYTDRLGFTDVNNNYAAGTAGVDDSLFASSSHGPTRDGRMKPDITATGENIATTGSSAHMSWLIANYPNVVTKDSLHMLFGGTSAASPAVAGFVALYLQHNPTATATKIKQDITTCSKRDKYTGTVPNILWGYGKLDGYNAMTCSYIGIPEMTTNSGSVTAYPNPATNEMKIIAQSYPLNYILMDMLGKTCVVGKVTYTNESININHLPNGIYMLRFTDNQGKSEGIRIVIE